MNTSIKNIKKYCNSLTKYSRYKTREVFIGDIPLGGAVPGKAFMTPLDLVPGGDIDTPAVINIARLLQSLDALPGDARITIPAQVCGLARRSNSGLSASIDALDFADDSAFVNAASQLVATLTQAYGFTAVLVDAATARQHLQDSLLEVNSLSVNPATAPVR